MVPQIFGTMKCRDTQKAIRFFRERGIKTHFVDLNVKGMSKGELSSVARIVPLEQLIDTGCRLYEKMNLHYIRHDIEEKLLETPLLLKTPVTRWSGKATVGYEPGTWSSWIEEEKKRLK